MRRSALAILALGLAQVSRLSSPKQPLGARPSELAMEAKQTKSKDLGIASTRGDKGT